MSKGWKLVPVEPTDEMIRAGWHCLREKNEIQTRLGNSLAGTETPIYRAMLAAAPTPPKTVADPVGYVWPEDLNGQNRSVTYDVTRTHYPNMIPLYTHADTAEVDRLRAEIESLRDQLSLATQAPLYSTRRDAERYRWLKTKLIGVIHDYDDSGKGMLGVSFKVAGDAWVGLSENIDAAMDLKPK